MANKIIYECLMGSHSYGTNTPTSDVDKMQVYLAPGMHYLGLERSHSRQKITDEEDLSQFELRHFINLCLDFNPNVIVALWVKDEFVLRNELGYFSLFREFREMFSSQKAYHTFGGYAKRQRSRMLGETTGKLGNKRKDLIERFGFDTKYAYHSVRLLRMCHEFLNTGNLQVYRENDGEELMRIRNGVLTLSEVNDIIDIEDRKCCEALANTKLPEKPDIDGVSGVLSRVLLHHCKKELG